MKNLVIVFLMLIAGGVFAQQSQTRNITPFTGIKVAEGIDVYLKKGDKESVRVEVTGTQVENVMTEVSGSYLKVHMKDGNYKGNIDAKVYVTYVRLDKLSASSAGNIFSDGAIKATDMEISASSAGSIEVGLETETVTVSASSAAEIELKGKTKSLSVDASSAGEVDAYDLEAQKVEADASSAGSVRVTVVQDLDAHASSGGNIRYRGSPSKSITDSSSGGSVKKSD
ncbi:MAG TPA: head GIN domain-containing protein [Ohtaekwangia sp.]